MCPPSSPLWSLPPYPHGLSLLTRSLPPHPHGLSLLTLTSLSSPSWSLPPNPHGLSLLALWSLPQSFPLLFYSTSTSQHLPSPLSLPPSLLPSLPPSPPPSLPQSARGGWLLQFMTFCIINRLPLDFVSTHHYPTGEGVTV